MTSNTEWVPLLEDVFYTRKFLEPTERFHELKIQLDVAVLSGHENSGSATEMKCKFLL